MGLSNEQFDNIMKKYEMRRTQNEHIANSRATEIATKLPRINEINSEIASTTLKSTIKAIEGDREALLSLREEIELLSSERELLLEKNGYPLNYLDPIYTCKACKDTGYIDNDKCHCLKQEIINCLYSQSNIMAQLKKENFKTFNDNYYSPNKFDMETGKNALENIDEVKDYCYKFIEQFKVKTRNIFITGDTGVGKTFLTNCIAKEIINKGNLVIYLSAIRLFEIFSDYQFSSKNIKNVSDIVNNIYTCDLLIIDDLGTEFTNTFTTSALFNCLNERIIADKSTIISSNLDIDEITKIYSERISSRIIGNYNFLKIFGEDIRKIKNI